MQAAKAESQRGGGAGGGASNSVTPPVSSLYVRCDSG